MALGGAAAAAEEAAKEQAREAPALSVEEAWRVAVEEGLRLVTSHSNPTGFKGVYKNGSRFEVKPRPISSTRASESGSSSHSPPAPRRKTSIGSS